MTGQPATPTAPAITRPQVLIVNAAAGRREARCVHCPWTYSNTVKVDVEQQARYHRGQHRAGTIR